MRRGGWEEKSGNKVEGLALVLARTAALNHCLKAIIGERERANLVVSTADFSLYIYIYIYIYIFRALDATIL